ncbi:MAG TPA: 4Fe-4S binding protein [Deltaproteobacteria bacterium]|nr:4Fe-4S binding protein [Deltaproteobacteria bacterium]
MVQQDVYRELSKKLMMENSTVLPRIWKIVCTDKEAEIVNALPGTAEELARKFEMTQEDMLSILQELYHRGAVFEAVRDGVTTYRMPRHMLQFHDATTLWKEAPEELFGLWVEFDNTEYPALLELVTQVKMPSFMRVVPIGETIVQKNQVLAREDALKMLESASAIAVTTCVCRKLHKKCDKSLEVCLQINRGAEYTIKRGTGRKIDLAEAIEILKRSQEEGLVPLTENMPGKSNVICNCCTCCCDMLRFAKDSKTKGVLAPSRYRVSVNSGACTGCGLCEDICPMGAVTVGSDDIAALDAEACIGCGLCATVCPIEALSLFEVRPADFIPS